MKLNLMNRASLGGMLVMAVLVAGGCSSTTSAPEPPAQTAEEKPARAPVAKSPQQAEQEARAKWHEYRAENPFEERLEEMGLGEDPGLEPDLEREYFRFGKPYKLEKFEKQYAIFRDAPLGWVRPFPGVSFAGEIYRDDDEFLWVWIPVDSPEVGEREFTTDPDKYHLRNLKPEVRDSLIELRDEFYLLQPPSTDETLRFVESSEGLPQQGSWRNSLDVADMNGDGHLDIVAPPQRGGLGSLYPTIFLGSADGTWSVWRARWPQRSLNYGAARVADFNADGHNDIAFALHLRGVAVYLGDGQGNFTDSSRGLPETDFPTRRIEIADVDQDGDPDIVALNEGPVLDRDKSRPAQPKMRIYRNHKNGSLWQEYQIGEAARAFGGDWLDVGNFNGDPYPDFVTSSIYFHGTDVFWLSDGEMNWNAFGRGFLPWHGYVGDVEVGNFTSGQYDDAVVSFNRFWPTAVNPEEVEHPELTRIAGIDVISFSGLEPLRIPVARWASKRATWAMESADINGDGHDDIIYSRTEPQENAILLGDGSGRFRRARVEGWDAIVNTAYEIKVVDVDQDGRLDIVIMYEDSGQIMSIKDGSIRVYLNRTGEASE